MSINDAIDRIRFYFNIDLRDRDRKKLEDILGNLVEVKEVTKIVEVDRPVVYTKKEEIIHLEPIAKEVCERHGVNYKDLVRKKRDADLVRARAEFIRIARSMGVTVTKLGAFLNRHHASIVYHANYKYQENKINRYKKSKQAL